MAKKPMQMAQKSWKLQEIFPRFVNAQMAKGVRDKTVLTYNRHFRSLGVSSGHDNDLFGLFSYRQFHQPCGQLLLKVHFQSASHTKGERKGQDVPLLFQHSVYQP